MKTHHNKTELLRNAPIPQALLAMGFSHQYAGKSLQRFGHRWNGRSHKADGYRKFVCLRFY
ncbi:MAG: hypothetical protein HFE75_06975 [Firmicutes bacterium]|nr:hypothetical protein [Bacillota bacterium]NBI61997.1 hypothetical protein [Clostridiales bacterium]